MGHSTWQMPPNKCNILNGIPFQNKNYYVIEVKGQGRDRKVKVTRTPYPNWRSAGEKILIILTFDYFSVTFDLWLWPWPFSYKPRLYMGHIAFCRRTFVPAYIKIHPWETALQYGHSKMSHFFLPLTYDCDLHLWGTDLSLA